MTIHSHDILPATGRPFVAVCGITCRSQADCAAAFGARCLVFDFHSSGVRRVSVEQAAHIASSNVSRLGCFDADDFSKIRSAMLCARLDFAVLHGSCEPVVAARELGTRRIIRAISGAAVTQEVLDAWTPHCSGFLLHAEEEVQLQRIAVLKTDLPRILRFDGCREAYRGLRPDGVALDALESRALLSAIQAVYSA